MREMTSGLPYLQTNWMEFQNSIINAGRTIEHERMNGEIAGGRIKNGLTRLEIPENLLVVGDLHGDMGALDSVLCDMRNEEFLSNPRNKIIFLGDYVDRGTGSIEVLQKVCDLKSRYPDVVILMRGNHEAPEDFPFQSHGLPSEITGRFGEHGTPAYNKVLDLFRLLTLVTIVGDKLFLVHGGPPTETRYMQDHHLSNAAELQARKDVLEEILWSDPRSMGDVPFEKSRRLFGKHFGETVSRSCLDSFGTKVIVRSHEPCQRYKIDHGGMVLTIFSCGEAYPKFEPSYMFITGEQLKWVSGATDLVPHIKKIKKGL